jgi:tetratricopeptide (TPR) repeat protein
MINRLREIWTTVGPKPSAEEFLSSAKVHFNAGRYQDVIADYDEAIRLKPQYAEYAEIFAGRGLAK